MSYVNEVIDGGGNSAQNKRLVDYANTNSQLQSKLKDLENQVANLKAGAGTSAQTNSVDYSSLYDRFYNEYLNPNLTANDNTYNNIIKYLNDTANSQIDQNEVNYRRNQRLLKEKMGRLGQTDSGLSTSDFNNLMIQRDKTNNSIKSQLASDVATQEANKASGRANIQQAASTYAANLINKLKG